MPSTAFAACLLLSLAACPMDSDDASADTMDSEGAMPPTFSISGHVSRLDEAKPTADNDGIGTLYIAVLEQCALTAPLAGAAVVPEADFSTSRELVAFDVPALAPGTYQLALFLDDNDDADPMAPTPGDGDIVYATGDGPDGILSCIEVSLDDSDVTDVALTLTFTRP